MLLCALRSRRGPRARGSRQRRIVLENRLLKLPQLLAGLEPELVRQEPPPLAVHLESLRLPPRAVEGEHELCSATLSQRLLAEESF